MENNQVLGKVPIAELGLIKALQSVQIRYLDRMQIDASIQPAVYKAFMNRGQFEIEQEKIDHIVATLGDSILKTCPNIRLDEIPLAIERGVLGEYGEYIGINVVSLVNFVKLHYASSERTKLMSNTRTPVAEDKNMTEMELLVKDRELLLHAFDYFKLHGYYLDYGNYIYKIAVKKLSLFELSDAMKRNYLRLGKSAAIDKIKSEMIQFPNQKNKLLKELEEASTLIPRSDGIRKLYKEALQLALNDWFGSLANMEVDMQELVNKAHSD